VVIKREVKSDFLIIGGGIIGLTIALELRKKYPSLKYIIESYGVRTDDKGINQIWEIDTQ
jgi:hypothetical protein